MPIHDWTRVGANRFHDFHQGWIIRIRDALNGGILPDEFLALAEQVTGGPVPDVIALSTAAQRRSAESGGILLEEVPIRTRHVARIEVEQYARKADRVVIHHRDGTVVAIIELVSPGNKSSRRAFDTFVNKAADFLLGDVSLLIVDLFPPTMRDPDGIHKAIWDQFEEEPFKSPPGRPLTLAAYQAGEAISAYVESVGVGDVMPDMPIFLAPRRYVMCPLESTYEECWRVFPRQLKAPLEESS